MDYDIAKSLLQNHIKIKNDSSSVTCVLMNDGTIIYNFATLADRTKIRPLLSNNDWGNTYTLGKDCVLVKRNRLSTFSETWEVAS
jgi:hypothetical protein